MSECTLDTIWVVVYRKADPEVESAELDDGRLLQAATLADGVSRVAASATVSREKVSRIVLDFVFIQISVQIG